MAPHYPVTILRSDGQTEVITKTGAKELNRPTATQLDGTPDPEGNVDCYRRLDDNEPRAVDWRRKIGGMLMQVLGRDAHAGMSRV